MVEGSTRTSSGMAVKQLAPRGGKGSGGAAAKGRGGSVIRATIPYVKADVPILVLFRALGTVVRRRRRRGGLAAPLQRAPCSAHCCTVRPANSRV